MANWAGRFMGQKSASVSVILYHSLRESLYIAACNLARRAAWSRRRAPTASDGQISGDRTYKHRDSIRFMAGRSCDRQPADCRSMVVHTVSSVGLVPVDAIVSVATYYSVKHSVDRSTIRVSMPWQFRPVCRSTLQCARPFTESWTTARDNYYTMFIVLLNTDREHGPWTRAPVHTTRLPSPGSRAWTRVVWTGARVHGWCLRSTFLTPVAVLKKALHENVF